MKSYQIAGLFLSVCLASAMLTGCTIGNTEIRLETGQIKNHKTIFRVNDYKCDVKLAKLYLCNYRNLYGNAYGLDLSQEEDLESYVKDITIQELSRIVCMDLLAREQDMSLDEEEQKLAKAAADEYYDSLSGAELAFMDVSRKDVLSAYEDYALAEKLYASLTQGVDEEVSDDEARVIRVQQIFVRDETSAEAVEEKLAAGEEFAAVASAFNQSGDIEITVAREEYPQEVENIAFNLENGVCSERIETEDGYYFIKCLNKYEEELTEANKEIIREKREKEQFEDSYQQFVDSADFQMNDTLWEEITLSGTSDITTDSFFQIYDKYFQ